MAAENGPGKGVHTRDFSNYATGELVPPAKNSHSPVTGVTAPWIQVDSDNGVTVVNKGKETLAIFNSTDKPNVVNLDKK